MPTDPHVPAPVRLPSSVGVPIDGDPPTGSELAGPHIVGLDAIKYVQDIVEPSLVAEAGVVIEKWCGRPEIGFEEFDPRVGGGNPFAEGYTLIMLKSPPPGEVFDITWDLTEDLPHGAYVESITMVGADISPETLNVAFYRHGLGLAADMGYQSDSGWFPTTQNIDAQFGLSLTELPGLGVGVNGRLGSYTHSSLDHVIDRTRYAYGYQVFASDVLAAGTYFRLMKKLRVRMRVPRVYLGGA